MIFKSNCATKDYLGHWFHHDHLKRNKSHGFGAMHLEDNKN